MVKFKKHFNSNIFVYGIIILFYLSKHPPIYSYPNSKDTLRTPVGAKQTLERMGQLLDVEGGKKPALKFQLLSRQKYHQPLVMLRGFQVRTLLSCLSG